MDFIDQLKQFSKRALEIKDVLTTEEATKNSLILPFFQMLGYDVFNPLQFVPEFTADVGIKKGEKVDYAIVLEDKPAILIEAKWCGEPLEQHDSQLFRYFGTTQAKFGILTNGITYRFYTDLDEPNKMDLTPFLEFDVTDIKESIVPEIKRFTREKIDIESAFNAASELKYTNQIKAFLAKQRISPDESFVGYILSVIYNGRRTQAVMERFTGIIKKAVNSYLNDVINETLKNAMQNHEENSPENNVPVEKDEPSSKIVTTTEELQAYAMIKSILHETMEPTRLSYKDTESYFNILCDGRVRQWICRLRVHEKGNLSFVFPSDLDIPKQEIEKLDDIYRLSDLFIRAAKKFL